MCMILKNVSLVLVEMNRQDVFTRLFFLPSSSLVFGITESLWSSFAGGRQYGVWAGERHSSCSCLPQWCSSPLPCTLLVNALFAIPRTFILRGLELFSKGIAPAMAHPKIIERRRSPMGRDAGSMRSWQTCVTCADLQRHAAASALVPMSLVLLLGREGS